MLRLVVVSALAALCLPATGLAAGAVSAFYYPWYGTAARDGAWLHWSQNDHNPPADIASNYFPARGVYSSADPAVLRSQMAEIRGAGIDEIVVSWWGRGSAEDKRLPAVLAAARRDGIAVAAHIEPYNGRTVASVTTDIGYLRGYGITDFYVYEPLDFPMSQWAQANETLKGVRVFAQTALVGDALAGHFDGVYTYDVLIEGADKLGRLCSEAHAVHLLCLPSVGPGYDAQRATGDPRVKPRDNGKTYDAMWRAAIAANPDEVTITSFNEWHEGTQIEPAAPRAGSLSYEGAWSLTGLAAEDAYLDRTLHWSELLRAELRARETAAARH